MENRKIHTSYQISSSIEIKHPWFDCSLARTRIFKHNLTPKTTYVVGHTPANVKRSLSSVSPSLGTEARMFYNVHPRLWAAGNTAWVLTFSRESRSPFSELDKSLYWWSDHSSSQQQQQQQEQQSGSKFKVGWLKITSLADSRSAERTAAAAVPSAC